MARKRTEAGKLREEMDNLKFQHRREMQKLEEVAREEVKRAESLRQEAHRINAQYIGFQKGVREVLDRIFQNRPESKSLVEPLPSFSEFTGVLSSAEKRV
jgi:hypothetical protein